MFFLAIIIAENGSEVSIYQYLWLNQQTLIKHYFNWFMNYSDLEYCIEEFFMREKNENIEALIREVEAMYMLNDPELIREVAYDLGNRGMPTDRALDMIKVLYTKTWERKSNK